MVAKGSLEDLPPGWTLQVTVLKTGRKTECYVNSITGQRFFSKDDFVQYMKTQGTHINLPLSTSVNGHSKDNQMQLVQSASEHPEWLPHGWIMELKTHKGGKRFGSMYKCYVDPSTGHRFYSKPDVFRYLKTVNHGSYASKKKETISSVSSRSKVIIKRSADKELPPGWIKELKVTKTADRIRRDPFYIDPVSGYVFRSKRDVQRYLETGEISRHAFLPKKRNTYEGALLPPIAKRQTLQHSTTKRQLCEESVSPSKSETSSKRSNERLPSETAMHVASTDAIFPEIDNNAKSKEVSNTSREPQANAQVNRNEGKRIGADNGHDINSETEIKEEQNTPLIGMKRFGEPVINSETEIKAEKNSPGSGMKMFGEGKSLNSSSKLKNKKAINLPCRSSKRLAGLEPELIANSISNVRSLQSDRKSYKNAATQTDGLTPDGIVDVSSNELGVEQGTELPHHTSTDANDPLYGEPSNKSQKSLHDYAVHEEQVREVAPVKTSEQKSKSQGLAPSSKTIVVAIPAGNGLKYKEKTNKNCLAPSKAEVHKRNEGQRISADNEAVFTSKCDILQEHNSVENEMEAGGKRKTLSTSSKSRGKKELNLLRRSSKRLAGLEPELAVNSNMQDLRSATRSSKIKSTSAVGLTSNDFANANDSSHGEVPDKGRKSFPDQGVSSEDVMDKTNKERQQSQLNLPFGELLADPCLEFAYKTLTGALPVENAINDGLVSTPAADIMNDKIPVPSGMNKNSKTKTPTNSSKSRKRKELNVPRRFSKRLSGISLEPIASSTSDESSLQTATRKSSKKLSALDVGKALNTLPDGAPLQRENGTESVRAQHSSADSQAQSHMEPSNKSEKCLTDHHPGVEEQSQKLEMMEKINNDNPETQSFFSFSNFWSDPCLEFAIKTLTGAIPVDDNLQIQSYFQQQINSSQTRGCYFQQQIDTSQTQRDNVLALPDFGLPSSFQTDISASFDNPGKKPPSLPQLPLNNTSFMPNGSLSIPNCSSVGSQQQHFKGNKELSRKVNS